MARDKEARKGLAEKALVMGDKQLTQVLIKMFDLICDIEAPDACMSASVSLLIALRYLGYEPKLCYGLCVTPKGYEVYHAWLELNNKVLDIAIYGNSHYSPYWHDESLDPVVFESYDATKVFYRDHVVDEDWEKSGVGSAITTYKTLKAYIDGAPNDQLRKVILKIMGETITPMRIAKLSRFITDEPL